MRDPKVIRRYRVATNRDWDYGIFIIADDGYFSVISSYGNYAFFWSAAGDNFRRFLARIDDGYLCSKLGQSDHYKGPETYKCVKEYILELRKTKALDKEEAREEMALLEEHDQLDRREDFALWYDQTSLHKHNDMLCELAAYGHDNQLIGFVKNIWPLFVEALKAELKSEHIAQETVEQVQKLIDKLPTPKPA